MNKIRVGVVGLGRLGFTHAENITTTKNASLVAVCSHSEEELKKAKEKLGVTNCFTDIIKMVELIAFIESLIQQTSSPISASEGLKSMLISLAAKKSIQEKRVVTLTEMMN
jgi:myo-inositol 2-dehydrogenase/D-chiro-inositol 1-dehydrogenase